MTAQYPTTVLQTITNPDGTVSIIQVDPSTPIITLPDGTTAQVQGVATVSILYEEFTDIYVKFYIVCFTNSVTSISKKFLKMSIECFGTNVKNFDNCLGSHFE